MNKRLLAEFIGTAFLLIGVVGSGIMAENLSGGNVALALLANSIATGSILYVLITVLGPISGAHFNPAVTLGFALRRETPIHEAWRYVIVQIIGGIIGVWATHLMFELPVFQWSQHDRTGIAQWWSEGIATFGLLFMIYGGLRWRAEAVPALVAMYITGAYWFTASTSFANPAVTIARSLSDTFAGIRPDDVPMFILAQVLAAFAATYVGAILFAEDAE